MRNLSPALALLCVPIAAVAAATPLEKLLGHVHEDDALVIVVPSMQGLTTGAAAFGKSIGVDSLSDLDARLLLEEIDLIDVADGLDVAGPVLLTLPAGLPNPTLLITIKDAAAWQKALGVPPGAAGIFPINGHGLARYAAIVDGVAILAGDEAGVQRALSADGSAGKRLQARLGPLSETAQLVVHVEADRWQPMLAAATTALQLSMRAGMAASGQSDEAALGVVEWIVRCCMEVLSQTQSLTAAARVDAQGISAQATATFRAGGSAADYLGKVRKVRTSLLRGLPDDEDYWCISSLEWELPPGTRGLDARWLEGLLSAQKGNVRLASEGFQKGLKATLAMYEQVTGYSVAMKRIPQRGLLVTGLYFSKQPQPVLDGLRCSMEISPELMDALGGGAKARLDCRTELVGSVPAQVYEMTFIADDEQSRRVLNAIYGPTMVMWAVPHAEGVAYASGPADAAKTQLAQLLAPDRPRLADNPRVSAAMRRLSPDPQACILLDLPRLVMFALDVGRAAGAPVPQIEPPSRSADLVAVGGYLDQTTVRLEVHVPASAIEVLVRTVRTLKQSVVTQR